MEFGLGPGAEAVLMLTIEMIQGRSTQMGWFHFTLTLVIVSMVERRFGLTSNFLHLFLFCVYNELYPIQWGKLSILGCWQNTNVYWRNSSNSQG